MNIKLYRIFEGVLKLYRIFEGVLKLYGIFEGVLKLYGIFEGVLKFLSTCGIILYISQATKNFDCRHGRYFLLTGIMPFNSTNN